MLVELLLLCGHVGEILALGLIGNLLVSCFQRLVDALDNLINDQQPCVLVLKSGVLHDNLIIVV